MIGEEEKIALLIDELEDIRCDFYADTDEDKTLKEAIRLIKASKQQPKTGHWKYDKCDKCGASRPPLFDYYCPNCGAKMTESD